MESPVDDSRSTRVFIVVAGVVLAIIVASVILIRRGGPPPSSASSALTEEQKAYLGQIAVTEVRMSAAQNFLGDTVTYLDARVTNKGTKVVRQLELELVFVDVLSQVVLREMTRPITPRTSPLKPGESRSFRVSFEHIPVDWNQTPPTVTPKAVQF